MSCMVMKPEPLAALANAVETRLNCDYSYWGFGAPDSLYRELNDCKISRTYFAEAIYKKLYALNIRAYNGRYSGHEEPAGEEAPIIDGSKYIVHRRPEYREHGFAVQAWHYHLAKLLDFWLYQTLEDATHNDPLRLAMVEFQRDLYTFIVTNSMPRNCTIDYKVEIIAKFIRWELLGYKKGQRLRPEDVKAHELHMGFSAEEKHRCKENPNRLFVNKFPLVEMGLIRADNYKYILENWKLDTKASACAFCPFHRNYFYRYVQQHEPETYAAIVGIDNLLRDKTPMPPMKSALFMSRSRKRITDLTPEDCNDAECFEYCGQQIWNGF